MVRSAPFALILALTLSGPAAADEVLLRSGSTLTGRILEEHSAGLTIDTVTNGIRATLRLPRADIRSVTHGPVPDSFFARPVPPTPTNPGPPAAPTPAAPKADDALRAEIVQSLIRSAERGDVQPMWGLVEVYKNGYANVPKNPARMAGWLARLCGRGEERAHLELAAHSTDAYARICQRSGVDPDASLVGKAIEVTGIVATASPERLKLQSLRNPQDGRELIVDCSHLELPKALVPGRAAMVRGMVRPDRSVLGLFVQLPAPKFEYRYALDQRRIIADYQQHRTVTLTVVNTGQQHIRRVELTLRYSDPGCPDNPQRKVTLRDIPPGEERSMEVEISLYFQTPGGTSPPRISVTPGEPVW